MIDTKKIDDGGPAFARSAAEHGHGGHYEQDGMSLREYYAGLAMQGILAGDTENEFGTQSIVDSSVEFADRLIAALKENHLNEAKSLREALSMTRTQLSRFEIALQDIIRADDTGPMTYEQRGDGPCQAIGGSEGKFAAIARAALGKAGVA